MLPVPETASERRRDLVAVLLLLLASTAATAAVAGDVVAYLRGDWPTMFLPLYSFLGERLRAFDVPGWNPYQFAGAPFAGDPSSGWGYVPAMLVYALVPALPATTLFIGLHVALSAIGAYVLARLIGLNRAGAFVAGTAYAFPWLVPAAAGQVLFFHVTAWLPVALIGVEVARLPVAASRRFAGLALSGFAISQILAAWLGQGSYYALLVITGWVAWRTLVTPPPGWSPRGRLLGLAGIGAGVLLLGFALNAAALLIRLDVNARTNVAGGVYTGISRWSDSNIGQPLDETVRTLTGGFGQASWQYVGAAVVALALLAPFVAPRWPPLVFWLLTGALAIVLALAALTPVHALAYAVLPRFESLHAHLPGRVLLVVPLAMAMLAGATADALSRSPAPDQRRQAVALVGAVIIAAGAIGLQRQAVLSHGSLLAALAVLAVAGVAIALPVAARATVVPLALAVIILWDPAGRVLAAGWGETLGPQRSLRTAVAGEAEQFLYENGTATFLLEATRETPGRYAGYDPALLPDIAAEGDMPSQAYRNHWLGPSNWLLVHDWATWFGVEDVQGYNPIQSQRYVAFIDALNGHRQEYHERDLFPAGLTSPLLDLLNVRFLLVPADAPDREDLAPLLAEFPETYANEHVRVLENPGANTRAWLVHAARQVAPGEALPLLAGGSIDPRQTALLEVAPPELVRAREPASETAVYLHQAPDRLEIAVSAQTPALLVVSEVWDPGWRATVDGQPAPVYVADHVLRAVPVPAGEHQVVLTYEPDSLRAGIAISLLTVVAIVAIWAGLRRRERRS